MCDVPVTVSCVCIGCEYNSRKESPQSGYFVGTCVRVRRVETWSASQGGWDDENGLVEIVNFCWLKQQQNYYSTFFVFCSHENAQSCVNPCYFPITSMPISKSILRIIHSKHGGICYLMDRLRYYATTFWKRNNTIVLLYVHLQLNHRTVLEPRYICLCAPCWAVNEWLLLTAHNVVWTHPSSHCTRARSKFRLTLHDILMLLFRSGLLACHCQIIINLLWGTLGCLWCSKSNITKTWSVHYNHGGIYLNGH